MGAVCVSCGSPIEPGQEYCLRCGARATPVPKDRHVPSWIWASLGALVIAAGGAAAAIAANRSDDGATERTIVALSKLRPAPAPAPTAKPNRTRTKPGRTSAAKRGRTLITWPGTRGYTIVLASIPIKGGIARARRVAEVALRRGLRNVGVLVSAGYSSLHPGYYVVFSGVYGSVEEAQGKLPAALARFPNAYARQITR